MKYEDIKKLILDDHLKAAGIRRVIEAIEWQKLTHFEQQNKRKEYAEFLYQRDKASKIYDSKYTNLHQQILNFNLEFCEFLMGFNDLYEVHSGFKLFRNIIFHYPNFVQKFLHREGVYNHLHNLLDANSLDSLEISHELKNVKEEFQHLYEISNLFNRRETGDPSVFCSIVFDRKLLNKIGLTIHEIISSIDPFNFKMQIEHTDKEIRVSFNNSCAQLTVVNFAFIDLYDFQLSPFEIGKKKMSTVN